MYKKVFKRPLDIIISLVAIILLSPIFIAIGIFVLIKHGWPIIFIQKRPGIQEKIFSMYKFRTMTNHKDKHGKLLPDDERLTKFGRTLRSTSLDELPELFNVLKGDMSLVGPRPLMISYLPYYNSRERKRHTVLPGITGLAQIKGRNLSNWDERLENDVKYVESISFFTDVRIILATIYTVLLRKDIAVGEEHIMQDLNDERRSFNK